MSKVDDADEALRAAQSIVAELGDLDVSADPSPASLRRIRAAARAIAAWSSKEYLRTTNMTKAT
jgi:hypothetical protein